MISVDNSPSSSERETSAASYWMTYVAIAFVILIVDIFTDPARYADFDTYVYYLDALVYYPPKSWLYFEVLSNLNLLSAHWLTRSVLSGIVFAHYMLGIIFLLAMPIAYPPRRTSWPALLFTFAVLGPLLAFVTLRATPAYFLIAIGVHFAIDRRPMAWLCLAAATSFHISSLLAAIPLALLYFERSLPAMFRSDRSRINYLRIVIAIGLIGAVLPNLSGSLDAIIKSIPVISKYEVYTEVNETAVTQIGHYIFLVFVVLLTVSFMAVQSDASRKLNIYVLASFIIYIMLFMAASPVVAFRQTPFWIMPLIAALPWSKLGVRRATVPLFVFACAVLGAFQFSQVYV